MAALCATGVLAVGFAVVIERTVAAQQPAPTLRTVPSGTLAGVGITLAAADQPPYCGATRLAAAQGWTDSAGSAGCAVDRAEAVDAAQSALPGSATEALLAQVTASGSGAGAVGHARLAWVVVIHSSPFVLPAAGCVPPDSTGQLCASRRLPLLSHQEVVIVDGTSGRALAALQLPTPAVPAAPAGAG